jgi:2,4-dienoyl-CoA reductase-like NADH-dependent reductase (Old Yellow Enzyme family)
VSRSDYKLFSEGTLGQLTLKNRLVRSATYEAGMTPDGQATNEIVELYRRLAEGGVGLIVTGITSVTPPGRCNGKGFPGQAMAYNDSQIGELARIAGAVHDAGTGCKVMAQVCHTGRQVADYNDWADCVGPSAMPHPFLKKAARELSVDEIRFVAGCFADGISRVKRAGFDGAQLHAAHGYLLSSFLSPYTNHRTDAYGGSVENRVRIVREIVAAARQQVGSFPILIKLNCDDHLVGGIDIAGFPALAAEVEQTGVDAIEVSGAMWDCVARPEAELGFPPVMIPESRTRISDSAKQSYYARYVEQLSLGVPVILVGGHRNVESMEEMVRQGEAEFLSLCRPLIAEPGLPNRWLEGRGSELAECRSCNRCLESLAPGPIRCMRHEPATAA